jgi:hypothetical protein
MPEPAAGAEEPAELRAERVAAQSLLFAAASFAVAAFFLSQSYKALLFLNCGLVVGRYLGMREIGIPVPRLTVSENAVWVAGAAFASIVAIWLLVKILI